VSHVGKLGTVSLDGATMLSSVFFDRGVIQLGAWLPLVPECMRAGALLAAEVAMENIRGYRATEETRHHFIGLMNSAIHDAIEFCLLTRDGWLAKLPTIYFCDSHRCKFDERSAFYHLVDYHRDALVAALSDEHERRIPGQQQFLNELGLS
jgi:hypothetical protein